MFILSVVIYQVLFQFLDVNVYCSINRRGNYFVLSCAINKTMLKSAVAGFGLCVRFKWQKIIISTKLYSVIIPLYLKGDFIMQTLID